MNVALVVTNLAGGGAEAAMLRLAAALGRRGHSVHLILLENRVEYAVPTDVNIVAVNETSASTGVIGKWLNARRLRALFRKLRLGDDCLTISTLPFADEVASRAGLPHLWFRIANTLSEEVRQLSARDAGKGERRRSRYRSLYEGRNLVAVSDGVAQDLRTGLGLERARIVRIYNGFDLQAIRQAAEVPAPALPREPFVLHVGRFMPQKRHDVLLDAYKLAALPHKLVLLAAPCPALQHMIAARQLQERVLLAGFQPNPYPWMRAAELLVLSSDREGMPNVLVEALACGTRVVSTDCPSGPREVRGALARGLVPTGDSQALAKAMRAALLDGWARPGAVDVPQEFTAEAMAAGYEKLAAHD